MLPILETVEYEKKLNSLTGSTNRILPASRYHWNAPKTMLPADSLGRKLQNLRHISVTESFAVKTTWSAPQAEHVLCCLKATKCDWLTWSCITAAVFRLTQRKCSATATLYILVFLRAMTQHTKLFTGVIIPVKLFLVVVVTYFWYSEALAQRGQVVKLLPVYI